MLTFRLKQYHFAFKFYSFVVAFLIALFFVKPSVWVDDQYISVRKYLRKEKIALSEIAQIHMVTVGDYDEHISNYFIITLKFVLKDKRAFVVNRKASLFSPSNMTSIVEAVNPKNLFKNYDTTSFLLSQDHIKKILHANPGIALDTFTQSYLKTGNVEEYLKIVDGYYS